MEAVILGFALGAGTVLAFKHGRRVARRAIGWTAERTGFVTAKVTEALEEARRIARQRFDHGQKDSPPTEPAPLSVRDPAKNGKATLTSST